MLDCRNPVNANPNTGLKNNQTSNFSYIKIFFTPYVLGSSRLALSDFEQIGPGAYFIALFFLGRGSATRILHQYVVGS